MNKKIWLFFDRYDVADDNAEHFCRYIKNNIIDVECFYILKRDSKDYSRLIKDGFNIIDFEDDINIELVKSADLIFESANIYHYINRSNVYKSIIDTKRLIFLCHGMTLGDSSKALNRMRCDLFTCSIDGEYKSFKTKKYTNNEKYHLTGMPRHDSLLKKINEHKKLSDKKIVTFVFTYRKYLDSTNKNNIYYKTLNNIFNSEKLKDIHEKYNVEFNVKFHPEVIYKGHDKLYKFPEYVIDCRNKSYQDLIVDSDVFVSDYSSACQEFSITGRNILYYQFDKDVFFKTHDYSEDWFVWDEMSLGKIVKNLNDFFIELENIFKRNLDVPLVYKERMNNFFKFHDYDNCKRVYDLVIDTYYKNNIVVTLTSWKKRIDNCYHTIISCLNQSLLPDKIYLNLSVEEFPGKENDLPKSLMQLINNNKKIIINWIYGENTKTMKKVFPMLNYLNDEDYIVYIDDDIILPYDFIENRYNEFNKYNSPITGYNKVKLYKKFPFSCACSIIKKKMLNNWENIVDDDVIHTYEDDWVYTYILLLNGYMFKITDGIYDIKYILNNMIFNSNDSSCENNLYNYKYTQEVLNKKVMCITGKHIYDSFGFFNDGKINTQLTQEQLKKSNETQYQTSKNIQYFGNIKEDDNYEKLVSLIKSGQLKKKSSGVWYEVESNNEFNSIESSMLDVIFSIIEKQKEIEDRQKELNRLGEEQNVRMYSIHKQQESIKTDKQKIDEEKKNLELSKHQLDEDRKRLDVIKQGIKLEKKSKREQLKEDIATGKLVKVKMGNGYVWKRVR